MSAADHCTAEERGVILPCAQCQRANRIPFSRIHQAGHCGHCKAVLPLLSRPVEIDSTAAFSAMVQNASLPVLIDFWAPWCGPCKMIAPEVSKTAALASGEVLVAKVNTQDQPGIAAVMKIHSIPTFAVFAAGRELDRMSGAMSAPQLRAYALRAAAQSQPRA